MFFVQYFVRIENDESQENIQNVAKCLFSHLMNTVALAWSMVYSVFIMHRHLMCIMAGMIIYLLFTSPPPCMICALLFCDIRVCGTRRSVCEFLTFRCECESQVCMFKFLWGDVVSVSVSVSFTTMPSQRCSRNCLQCQCQCLPQSCLLSAVAVTVFSVSVSVFHNHTFSAL